MATATEHRLSRDQIIWSFGPDLEPALEVEPGDVVTLETNDCFTGQIRGEDDLVTDIDMARVNSATGPVAVRGAEPGDSLVVEFLSIDPVERGVATIIPGFGQLIDRVESPKTQVFRIESDEVVMSDRIRFPARPMVGVIGVATEAEELTNAFAGKHGGNLDDHLHGPGAKVYFPVRQPGGMFAVGDMHAAMGDGEICGTGVEIAGEVTVRFDLVKGRQSEWPVTELPDRWVAHGTSPGVFMDAMQAGCEDAAKLLVDQWGFTLEEAFVFISVACDVNVCQACQPSPFSAIARVEVPKIEACPRPFGAD